MALSNPANLTVDCGSGGIDNCSLSPSFNWDDVPGAVSYLIHYIQTDEACSAVGEGIWTELALHPTRSECVPGDPVAPCRLTVVPDRQHCWRIKAEGATEDSGWSLGPAFHTEELAPPPDGDGNGGNGNPIGLINPLQAKTLQEAIDAFVKFLFYLAMAVAPILIVYAGFLILTAGGDATKITKARQIILWTLVAVAIILFAKGFPALIKGALGG